MNFADYKAITIPEGKVMRIESGGVVLWEAGYTNQVPISIDTDGSIYNGTGYKDGYRVRSGGAESASSGVSCTGFIPCQPGDVVRISGYQEPDSTFVMTVNASDADFANLGQIASNYPAAGYGIFAENAAYQDYCWNSAEESGGVWKWTAPPADSGIAYIRVTAKTGGDGSGLIVTINEEIE